ncbi:MAG: tryptophanase [Candidatus Neomarinimicrobiota bacterium]|nr:MAG: tryptophanase [Candidatus Neomarinimicrobiota bacterium]
MPDKPHYRTVIEPFIIKSVQPIRLTTREQRERVLREARYNLFRVRSQDVLIDLLTDSGTGAMSSEQWAALMRGDEAYAGSQSFQRFEAVVKKHFGFRHVIPTHQGRAAERILFSVVCKPGDVVPNNTHFDTTRANIEFQQAVAEDLVIEEGKDPTSRHPFKGNLDTEKLKALIQRVGAEKIPLCMLTITNNSGGGQPVSMANIREVKAVLEPHGIPLYFDAARFAENAYFIKLREPEFRDWSVPDIVRKMMSYADGCTVSAKKDGLVNIGGFLCTNDDLLAQQEKDLLILTEGFPTYGGLAGRDLDALAVGLEEVMEEDYLKYRLAETRYLGDHLTEIGYPIVQPPGGHAIYIDAKSLLPHIPPSHYPGQSLSIEFYLEGGIRTVEIGSVMFGKPSPDGTGEIPAAMELVRLALPRRTHTQSHIDYVLEVARVVYENRERLRGVRITRQPPFLRHFTAEFELM